MKYLLWMLFSLMIFQPKVLQAGFKDIPLNHPHYEAIEYLQSNGLVSGYSGGRFAPDRTVNRVEFLKMTLDAWAASSQNENVRTVVPCFTHETQEAFFQRLGFELYDVDFQAWYGPYVCHGLNANIITGDPGGSFRPAQEVTFVEAAKIISLTLGVPVVYTLDVWYQGYVEALEERNAIPQTIKSAAQPLSRAQASEMLYRILADITDKPSKTYEDFKP